MLHENLLTLCSSQLIVAPQGNVTLLAAMLTKRQTQATWRLAAAGTLFIWLFALSYCSLLCGFPSPNSASNAPLVYSHPGCQGHSPQQPESDEEPFCDSIDVAYESSARFSLLKAEHTCWAPILDELLLREITTQPSAPEHQLDTANTALLGFIAAANQSHAPPLS
ncbi:MAG: hypothetical protein ACK4UN_11130 [Limisphaerales bacterium]